MSVFLWELHSDDYRKLLISSFKNILETLNVSSPKNLHET
ncbi:hypothetical protein LEP1GSC109_2165 [Leptospira interrogans str. UI 13372]|nr:hypothetical protein LEP1GSC087_1253 [Leptospira interrogans serovar Bataviae str. L1111]EMO92902.1 hypothetical protein LEP1GSC109_2165 [Leptospira interrogans str. UI 13372]